MGSARQPSPDLVTGKSEGSAGEMPLAHGLA
jgi:hypothetical protein